MPSDDKPGTEMLLLGPASHQSFSVLPKSDSHSVSSVGLREGVQCDGIEALPVPNADKFLNSYASKGTEQNPGVLLKSKFKQHFMSWVLSSLATIVLALSIWLIDTEFVNRSEVPQYLQLSPSHTVTLINALSQVNIFLVWALVDSVFEDLRWAFAARCRGVLITTFLAMSRATSFIGVADLLRIPGWHLFWCLQRLSFKIICMALGLVLLSHVDITVICFPEGGQSIQVVAGLAPFNAFSIVPASVIDIYLATFTRGILSDRTLVSSIPPITDGCIASTCTSIFLPGGLDTVRLQEGGVDSTLYQEPQLGVSSSLIINYAPGYQLEFFPVQDGYVFNSTTDCALYEGSSDEAIHICIAASGNQVLAGWSICPSDLFTNNLCFKDLSWTEQPDESTTMVVSKRYATAAYDRSNFSILSIEFIDNAEPNLPSQAAEIVGNFSHLFSIAFSKIPTILNTSDPDFPTQSGSFNLLWDLGFLLRLYQDDFRNYPGGPLSTLQSFLTVPIQFSTAAWLLASFDTLPSDLHTTASPSSSSTRALGKLWALVIFATGTGFLILWAMIALIWVTIWGQRTPNSSRFPEIDITAKARIIPSKEQNVSLEAKDLEILARENGMGNGTSSDFRARFKGQRLYVGQIGGKIALATERNILGALESGVAYH